MEDALIEVLLMRRFAGIDMVGHRIPDEARILAFWHLLEKNNPGKQIFETVKSHLGVRGMTRMQGDHRFHLDCSPQRHQGHRSDSLRRHRCCHCP